ncbi:MAG: hypothetical protein IT280_08315 [Ignavibacteria bacterium]|nr:hypothetical protein [Ignavibacteria bacterium]
MKRTVIDIGTNTILMLIGEFDKNTNSINKILDAQRVPRIGRGVDKNRNILPESITKAIEILNEYKIFSEKYLSKEIFATSTSFIRDSNNRDEFIQQIKINTGIKIEVLSGKDEAELTYIGGVYDKLSGNGENLTTIDIGGGSTEISTSTGLINNFKELKNINLNSKSFNIGSVRIKEKFLNQHPPAFDDIITAETFINENLDQINFDTQNTKLIGLAGTITSLGTIILNLDKFEAEKVDGLKITIDQIDNILQKLTPMPIEELYGMGDFMTGRADILIPGILILKCFMQKSGFESLTVSTKGLRYGVFLREEFKNIT